MVERLKQDLKEERRTSQDLRRQLERHQRQPTASIRTNEHERKKGAKLINEEKRAVLHCLEACREEKASVASVSTADPYLRTSAYIGVGSRTIHDVELGRNQEDRRGKHARFSSVRLLASDFRHKATELNLAGRVVTLNRLHKFARESWPPEYRIPSREMILRIMCEMGWSYKDASKAKNFVESSEIKVLRRKYLLQRRSEAFKDALSQAEVGRAIGGMIKATRAQANMQNIEKRRALVVIDDGEFRGKNGGPVKANKLITQLQSR
ncbi:hypothetical protein BGZ99_010131, partial [Dissophora globulifera]